MLDHTFLHLPGVGKKTERSLWKKGICSLRDFLLISPEQLDLFSPPSLRNRKHAVEESLRALRSGNADFFAERLPREEHYRVALTFPHDTAFLDIETTGLSLYYDTITLVGVSIGKHYHCHIAGTAPTELREILGQAKCLVTFNGTIFDLKFLEKEFPQIKLPKAHVDLRFFARRAGFSGGQKTIEDQLGIDRGAIIGSVLGERAPLLWHDYRLGDIEAAKLLIEYNVADVIGMKIIIDQVLDRLLVSQEPPTSEAPRHRFSSERPEVKWAKTRQTARGNSIYIPKFSGRKGPKITLRQLAKKEVLGGLRVVGIDLTGSEKRPTGWAVITGNRACTQTLASDREILERTVEQRPQIISIDSPLSIPKGRRRVDDLDPTRAKFGITRECERMLAKRGVKVYPCLIPSMQSLTARGIRLAKEFRKRGYAVIESYPGAAQDIMGIPRKRAGLLYLKKGLRDFGISGRFAVDDVSHDELDAITAAVVGQFFWAGRFEGLGNETEDFLIIPDLEVQPHNWQKRRVIGISGPISAGKTTAAEYIRDKMGFSYGRFSLVLADILKRQNKPINRQSLQSLGEKIHKRPGQRWFCKRLLASFPPIGDLVIDGLRFPEDHATIKEHFGPAFVHIHIDAAVGVREKRYLASGSSRDDFVAAIEHDVEKAVDRLKELAQVTLENNQTLIGFHRKLNRAIKSFFEAV